MKIALVIVSTAGGAGLAAVRLFRALRREGLEVDLFAAEGDHPEAKRVHPARGKLQQTLHPLVRRWRNWRNERLRRGREAVQEVFSDWQSDYGDALLEAVVGYDVIHLHWVAGLFDWRRFWRRLPPGVRLVWTLHDMNPFTAGFHYEDPECRRFADGNTPAVGREAKILARKAAWLRSRPLDLTIVAPSEWMRSLAADSAVFAGFPSHTIPNVVDLERFSPGNRLLARDRWGLPEEAFVILFVADLTGQRRKGFDLLEEALDSLGEVNAEWISVSVGRGENPRADDPRHRHLGALSEDELPEAYRAADVFVLPSRLDNAPNTVVEAFACGIPVVATPVGGVPEYVRNGETGCLGTEASPASLAGALRQAMSDEGVRRRLGGQAREWAEAQCAPSIVARRHLEIYRAQA